MTTKINSLNYMSSMYTNSLTNDIKAKVKDTTVELAPETVEKEPEVVSASAKLSEVVASAKVATGAIVDDSAYTKRVAISSSTDVSLSVADGAKAQNSTINVSELAQNHIMQSGRFASRDAAVVSTYDATFKMSVNAQSYSIEVKAGTTLEQFAQKINDATGGVVTAGILDTGAAKNPFVMTLKTKDTGLANKIKIESTFDIGLTTKRMMEEAVKSGSAQIGEGELSINGVSITMAATKNTSSSEDNALALARAINAKISETGVRAYTHLTETDKVRKISLKNLNGDEIEMTSSDALNELIGKTLDKDGDENLNTDSTKARTIQSAKDARFAFNGELMTRSSNEITDLVEGATLKLNKADGFDINLTVAQELSNIPTLVDNFTASYGALSAKDTGLSKQDLSKVAILHSNTASIIAEKSADGVSLEDYGFSLNNGVISVDKNRLSSSLMANPSFSEALLKVAFDKIYLALDKTLEAAAVSDDDKEPIQDTTTKSKTDYQNRGDIVKLLQEQYREAEERLKGHGSTIKEFQQTANSIKKQLEELE